MVRNDIIMFFVATRAVNVAEAPSLAPTKRLLTRANDMIHTMDGIVSEEIISTFIMIV